jgi:hypothetical protein
MPPDMEHTHPYDSRPLSRLHSAEPQYILCIVVRGIMMIHLIFPPSDAHQAPALYLSLASKVYRGLMILSLANPRCTFLDLFFECFECRRVEFYSLSSTACVDSPVMPLCFLCNWPVVGQIITGGRLDHKLSYQVRDHRQSSTWASGYLTQPIWRSRRG